jgi:hypothetical protein
MTDNADIGFEITRITKTKLNKIDKRTEKRN